MVLEIQRQITSENECATWRAALLLTGLSCVSCSFHINLQCLTLKHRAVYMTVIERRLQSSNGICICTHVVSPFWFPPTRDKCWLMPEALSWDITMTYEPKWRRYWSSHLFAGMSSGYKHLLLTPGVSSAHSDQLITHSKWFNLETWRYLQCWMLPDAQTWECG